MKKHLGVWYEHKTDINGSIYLVATMPKYVCTNCKGIQYPRYSRDLSSEELGRTGAARNV
jgi:hypothetical protein